MDALSLSEPQRLRLLGAAAAMLDGIDKRGKSWAWVAGVSLVAGLLALVIAVQPILVLLLLIGLAALAALIWLLRSLAPGAPWWIKGSLFVVCGQLVLSYGFSNIIFFAGGVPIPLTDSMLMLALLYSAGHVLFAREPVRLPAGLWAILGWVLFCIAWHLPEGLRRDGVGAARDAMPTVQMLYVLVGFVVIALCLRAGAAGERWLRGALLLLGALIGVYGLLYPLASVLLGISPRISSLQQSVPIIGYFTTWPAAGVLSVVGLMLWRWQAAQRGLPLRWPARLLGAVILVSGLMTFFMIQARIAYVFILLSLPILLLIGGQAGQVLRIFGAVLLGLSVLFAVELSGLELQGRVGRLSASGVYHHLATLTGATSDSGREFAGAAGGVNQRRQWRDYALGLWAGDVPTRMLGIGYGYVLTDLTTGGTGGETLVVREPHNSYVTTLTRTGLAGLAVMLALHLAVAYCCLRRYRELYRIRPAPAAFFLGALCYELYSLLNAWGEPHYEVAHFAVPSYFIYGAVFAVYAHCAPRPRQRAAVPGEG